MVILRLIALLAAVLVLPVSGTAEIKWVQNTPAQVNLKNYVLSVNQCLAEQGELPINVSFGLYNAIAVFGISPFEDTETPRDVEITFHLAYDFISSVEVRISAVERFAAVSAAFIQALNPDTISAEEALVIPTKRMNTFLRSPDSSYEEEVEPLNGSRPRTYYSYFPNQYHDGVNWAQLDIIFPLPGTWTDEDVFHTSSETKAPDTWSDHSSDYDGYDSEDDYPHFEVFSTPTPEPDSAAAEYDPYDR